MDFNRFNKQLEFIKEIDKLKHVRRRSILLNGERRENSAEHCWHVAVMAMLLCEYSNSPVDAVKVMKMLTIHDIIEIEAGDTYVYDTAGLKDQEEREQKAADKIFGILPDDQNYEFRALWDEFEAAETSEAKFGKAIDRLMPLLHNVGTGGEVWTKNNIHIDQVMNLMENGIKAGSEDIWQYAQQIIKESAEKGWLRTDTASDKK